MRHRYYSLLVALVLLPGMARAQMAEVYAGHKRTGIDLMWFRNFRHQKGQPRHWLYFSRNRASISSAQSPVLYGSTNAVSYNFTNGLGLVGVTNWLATGVVPKAGLQYYKRSGNMMVFGWLVADLVRAGSIDAFVMWRFQPSITQTYKAFLQAELFPVYTPGTGNLNITQRVRLGARYHDWVAGPMADFNESGQEKLTLTVNAGLFLRYEF